MIDLHCHLLPGIDDGAKDLSMTLEMARMAVSDGIFVTACTSHITPGIYDNNSAIINDLVATVQGVLDANDIKLDLVTGADIRVVPDLAERLSEGSYPTVANTAYFLFEPSHHVLPPNMVNLVKQLITIGYIPILTHPERLTWIESHYDIVKEIDRAGAVIQITAGAIIGKFGKQAKYWSERMLEEGRVDIIASDAHNVNSRPPILSVARDAVAKRLDEATSRAMTYDNPVLILKNQILPQKRRRELGTERANAVQTSLAKRMFRWIGGSN